MRRNLYRAGSALGWVNAFRKGTTGLRLARVFLFRLLGGLIGRIK